MIPDNNSTALVLLSIVVIASGCAHTGTSEDTEASTQAVQVVNFTAIPDTVFESQEPTLRLTLKNTGSVEATEADATLFNVPFGQPEQRQWAVSSRKFEFGTLRPRNEEAGLPATPKERTKTVTPPDLSDGETIPYDFMTRIFFKYSSRATTEIQLMGQKRFRDTGAARARPDIENSDGPIQMEVRTRTPVVFYQDGSTSSNLCLIVRNEGTGTPTWPNDRSQEDVVELQIRSSGSMSFETLEGQANRVDMVGNRGIKCYEISGFEDFSSTDIQRTIPITFEADYGYKKQAQTSITVKGRGTSSSSSTSSGDDDGSAADTSPGPS